MPLHILREIRDLYRRLSERAQNMIASEIPVTAQQREELEQRNEVESLPERLRTIHREVNIEVERLIDIVLRAQEERLVEGDSASSDSASSSDNQSGGNKEEYKNIVIYGAGAAGVNGVNGSGGSGALGGQINGGGAQISGGDGGAGVVVIFEYQ